MNEAFGAWWRARTNRERLLLAGALWFALLAAAPALAWQSASLYRQESEARLARAEVLASDVAAIDPVRMARASAAESDLRGFISAEATAARLTLSRVEPQGPDRLRFIFEAGDSLAALRLLDGLSRAGLTIDRVAFLRADDQGAVTTEIDVRGAGS